MAPAVLWAKDFNKKAKFLSDLLKVFSEKNYFCGGLNAGWLVNLPALESLRI
jgi:hypothetical protein